MIGLIKKVLFLFIFFFLFLPQTFAEIKASLTPSPVYQNTDSLSITLISDRPAFDINRNYTFSFFEPGVSVSGTSVTSERSKVVKPQSETSLAVFQNFRTQRRVQGQWTYVAFQGEGPQNFDSAHEVFRGSFYMYPTCDPQLGCPALRVEGSNFKANSEAAVFIRNAKTNTDYTIWFDGEQIAHSSGRFSQSQISNDAQGFPTASLKINVGEASVSPKFLCLSQTGTFVSSVIGLNCDFRTQSGISVTSLPPSNIGPSIESNQPGIPPPTPTPTPPPLPLNCVEGLDAKDKPTTDKKLMVKCTKIDTAFGAFDIEPAGFIKKIFSILLGFAGAVAVLLIIISGYRLMTSQGNPEKVQEAREQLTSAVVGLLFIIFSVAILQIIGVDILKLPGFRPQ